MAAWQSDADYLAAIRGANLDTANGEADVRTRQSRLRRNLTDLLPELARQGTFEREGISTGYLTRGTARSGMHQDSIARQQYDENKRVADAKTTTYDNLGDLETGLARLRAEANRRRTDAGYGAQQRSYAQTQAEALRSEADQREAALAGELRGMQESWAQQVYGAPPKPPAPVVHQPGYDPKRPWA